MSTLDDLAARLESEAAACLDVAAAFPDGAVGIKSRGKAVAFACAADWVREALDEPDLATELAERGLRACCGLPGEVHCR